MVHAWIPKQKLANVKRKNFMDYNTPLDGKIVPAKISH